MVNALWQTLSGASENTWQSSPAVFGFVIFLLLLACTEARIVLAIDNLVALLCVTYQSVAQLTLAPLLEKEQLDPMACLHNPSCRMLSTRMSYPLQRGNTPLRIWKAADHAK